MLCASEMRAHSRYRVVEGNTALAPGVILQLETSGYPPGRHSVLVRLPHTRRIEVDPKGWPLTPDGLCALDQDEIAHEFAERDGAQNIPAMDAYLSHLGVAHYTVGYDLFTFERFHADLKKLVGRHPIIPESARGGMLPDDEESVFFHFSCCGGIDTGPHGDGIGGGYLWSDGDNRADDGTGKPVPSPTWWSRRHHHPLHPHRRPWIGTPSTRRWSRRQQAIRGREQRGSKRQSPPS